jgi:hypothetical protein
MASIHVTSQSDWISKARSASAARVGRSTKRVVFNRIDGAGPGDSNLPQTLVNRQLTGQRRRCQACDQYLRSHPNGAKSDDVYSVKRTLRNSANPSQCHFSRR